MIAAPANVNELRNALCEVFSDLCNSTMEPKRAKEANNAAGKIIGTIRAELEAADQRKEPADIPFLDYDKPQKKKGGK
jgi:hypothetical protein